MKQAEAADAMEALRQDVLQEAAKKLIGRQAHEALLVVVGLVVVGTAKKRGAPADAPAQD